MSEHPRLVNLATGEQKKADEPRVFGRLPAVHQELPNRSSSELLAAGEAHHTTVRYLAHGEATGLSRLIARVRKFGSQVLTHGRCCTCMCYIQ